LWDTFDKRFFFMFISLFNALLKPFHPSNADTFVSLSIEHAFWHQSIISISTIALISHIWWLTSCFSAKPKDLKWINPSQSHVVSDEHSTPKGEVSNCLEVPRSQRYKCCQFGATQWYGSNNDPIRYKGSGGVYQYWVELEWYWVILIFGNRGLRQLWSLALFFSSIR
jgi:hypothetical protein